MNHKILDNLYDAYYREKQSSSEVISSHWSKVGWSEVRRSGKRYSLVGSGFGALGSRTPLARIYNYAVAKELRKIGTIHLCDEDLWELGKSLSKALGVLYAFDCVKQVLSLSRVISELNKRQGIVKLESRLERHGIRKVCVIGDGYGFLGNLIKLAYPEVQVTFVNLGKILFFDAYSTLLVCPKMKISLVEDFHGRDESSDFRFLPAEKYHYLDEMPLDLVFNIASMQEMNLPVINNYMNFIRPKSADKKVLFYCCNREEKRLPDGETIRFSDYGWQETDDLIFDELTPWYQSFPVGIFARRIPFDGEIRHRFVSLAPSIKIRPS